MIHPAMRDRTDAGNLYILRSQRFEDADFEAAADSARDRCEAEGDDPEEYDFGFVRDVDGAYRFTTVEDAVEAGRLPCGCELSTHCDGRHP